MVFSSQRILQKMMYYELICLIVLWRNSMIPKSAFKTEWPLDGLNFGIYGMESLYSECLLQPCLIGTFKLANTWQNHRKRIKTAAWNFMAINIFHWINVSTNQFDRPFSLTSLLLYHFNWILNCFDEIFSQLKIQYN